MQLLGTSTEIAFDRTYPFENRYLTYLELLARRAGEPFEPTRWTMDDLMQAADDRIGPLPFSSEIVDRKDLARDLLTGLWSGLTTALAQGPGGPYRYYAEKYLGRLDDCIAAGLNPVVVDVVRDPRDVIVSIRAFNQKRNSPDFGRANVSSDAEHLQQLIADMGTRLEFMKAQLPVEHILVRYEDLIADLAGQTRRLEDLLGVALDASRVEADRPTMVHHTTAGSSSESVGRWLQEMTPEDRSAVEEGLGGLLEDYGYTRSPARRRRLFRLRRARSD
jgi:hypothetical protein